MIYWECILSRFFYNQMSIPYESLFDGKYNPSKGVNDVVSMLPKDAIPPIPRGFEKVIEVIMYRHLKELSAPWHSGKYSITTQEEASVSHEELTQMLSHYISELQKGLDTGRLHVYIADALMT